MFFAAYSFRFGQILDLRLGDLWSKFPGCLDVASQLLSARMRSQMVAMRCFKRRIDDTETASYVICAANMLPFKNALFQIVWY